MPLRKFGKNDILYNQIKTHPSSSFFVYSGTIYYNNRAVERGGHGVFSLTSVPSPTGSVSLFEYNVDRSGSEWLRHSYHDVNADRTVNSPLTIGPSSSVSGDPLHSPNVQNTGLIYPFIVKGLAKQSFKNIKRWNYVSDYNYGDIITGSYQMSASISRKLFQASHNFNDYNITGSAIKNSLDYAKRLGEHYDYPSGSSKETNLIQIPSIFYGSEIKKGTVKLNFYVTGTLVAQLRDSRRNGALIQKSFTRTAIAGTGSTAFDNEIAGCVLYKEGFILLTGSWELARHFPTNIYEERNVLTDTDYLGNTLTSSATWTRFGMGMPENFAPTTEYSGSTTAASASFSLEFAGTHKIPTMTMLTHANKGEFNHSNNPTYISSSNENLYSPVTGSNIYIEPKLKIKNVHSSSYADPSGSLVKTTYITKIGIYDEREKLIGIASLAKPVKKTEDRDLTFKLKLDI